MSQTFKCPNCGAPIEYEGGPDLTMECPYCKSSVIVPEELRTGRVLAGALGEVPQIADVLGDVARLAGPLAEIGRLVRSGKKIEAVKLYRQTFNVGLQEAKEAVDKIERGEPLTMADVTVERITGGEPVATTDRERWAKGIASASIALSAASMATPAGAIAVILACLVGFALLFYAFGILPLRLNPVYRTAMELVKNDPVVVELFGSPVKDSPFVIGTLERFRDGSESLGVQVGIRGPRTRGTAYILGEKERDGTCSISSVSIRIGDEIVLAYNGSEPEKGFQPPPAAEQMGILPPTPVPSPTLLPSPTPTPPGYASPVLQFGGEGTGAGLFQDARSIAVDGTGHIYVAEYIGGRVQVFDPTGKFITQWFVGDSGTRITGMTADRQGTVYVVADGAILRIEGMTGRSLGKLEYPDGDRFHAVTLTLDGGLLATWYEARSGLITSIEGYRDDLVRFDPEGNVTQVLRGIISSLTDDVSLYNYPAVDGRGNIFIFGGMGNDIAIFRFTPEGRFVDRFSSHGSGPEQLEGPGAIAVDNQSRVYVAGSSRIQVFDATGRYLGMFGTEGYIFAMAFNDQNELFAVTSAQQVIQFRLNQP